MAFQQNISGLTMNTGSEDDVSHKQMQSSNPPLSDHSNGCFDCNICLDTSFDPVVTLCGHLYCWPCIYKWLHVQNSPVEHHKCPVCKSHISTSTLVPLYGRGETKKPNPLDLTVPHRPPALEMNSVNSGNHPNHQNPFPSHNLAYQQQQYFPHSIAGPSISTNFYSPTINMVGEMVFARMFGSQDTNLFAYPYSSYSHFSGNGRRQEMQLGKSLNRVCIFLFCCIVLCLILF